jgi:hypothetical protein
LRRCVMWSASDDGRPLIIDSYRVRNVSAWRLSFKVKTCVRGAYHHFFP